LTFATVRHRTKVTKGPGSKATGIAMAFTLIEVAQERWRAVNAPHLVALVRAGARFECGELVERDPVLEGHPSRRRHPCSVARRLESTRQQRRVDLHPQVLTLAPRLVKFPMPDTSSTMTIRLVARPRSAIFSPRSQISMESEADWRVVDIGNP
jgi:hypothetical protein